MITALVPAAGSGERLGWTGPKALAPIRGRPLLVWSIEALAAVDAITSIVVAAPRDVRPEFETVRRDLGVTKWVTTVDGGAERRDTVRALLDAADSPRVLVHDAARPCIGAEWVSRLIEAGGDAVAAVPALPVRDTIKRGRRGEVVETVPRDDLFSIQTPQIFDREVLLRAHDSAHGVAVTDDAMLVERLGLSVRLLTGDPGNLKVTFPEDVVLAEALLEARRDR